MAGMLSSCAMLSAIAALAAGAAGAASAADPPATERVGSARLVQTELGGDRYAAGATLRIDSPAKGDLVAAGGRVEVGAPVGGDALLVGGEVRLRSAVAADVYAAGGRVQIAGEVGRNLRAVGGQVELLPTARLAGNASLAGGEVILRAPVKGSVHLAGAQVLIDAAVDGDVVVTARRIELGPSARVGGALRWRSASELERHPAAQVTGAVQRLEMPAARARDGARDRERDVDRERERGDRARIWSAAGWIALVAWTLGLMLVAAVAIAALPGASARVVEGLQQRWAWSLLIGFVTLVCVPVAVVILMVSLIGAPLGLLALLLYLVLLPLGYLAGAAALGQWALDRWKADVAERTGWRIGAAVVALLLLGLIGRVPFAGWLALFALALAGMGAIVRQLPPKREPARDETPA